MSLPDLTAELPSANFTNGCTRIQAGVDANLNGLTDSIKGTSTLSAVDALDAVKVDLAGKFACVANVKGKDLLSLASAGPMA